MTKLALFGFALASIIPLAALNGWAIQQLWEWFIMPQFGLEPLKFVNAIGLALFVSYMTMNPSADDSDSETAAKLAVGFLKPPFVVLVGWIFLGVFG